MKTQLFILCILLTLGSCKEDSKFLYDSRTSVSGTAYLNDTELKSNLLLPAKAVDVTVKQDTTKPDYLYKAKTDANGYFELSHIPQVEGNLYIYAETEQDGIQFKGTKLINSTSEGFSFTLTPVYKNAIKLTVTRDGMEPWHSINTYLYQNKTLANEVKDKIPTNGFISTAKTNENGVVIFTNLQATKKYQIVVADSLKELKIGVWGIKSDLTVLQDKIVRETLIIP